MRKKFMVEMSSKLVTCKCNEDERARRNERRRRRDEPPRVEEKVEWATRA
jgi:hypothetical protein